MTVVRLRPLVFVALLAGCASNVPAPVEQSRPTPIELPAKAKEAPPPAPAPGGPTYTVKKGDTLYAIALDQGLDYKDIVAWNGLENPNRILVGQVLRLSPPDGSNATGVVTRPIAAPANLEVRPVKPVDAPVASSSGASTEMLKRDPKGGKVPYSPEALERLRKVEGGKAEIAGTPIATVSSPAPVAAVEPPPVTPQPAVAAGAIEWSWPLSGAITVPFSEGSSKGVDIAAKPGEPIGAAASGKVVYAGSGLRGYGKLVIIRHSSDYLSAYAHAREILVKEGQSVTRLQKIAEVGDTDTDHPKLHFEVRFRGVPVDPQKYLPPR